MVRRLMFSPVTCLVLWPLTNTTTSTTLPAGRRRRKENLRLSMHDAFEGSPSGLPAGPSVLGAGAVPAAGGSTASGATVGVAVLSELVGLEPESEEGGGGGLAGG